MRCRTIVVIALLLGSAACAARTPPGLPLVLRYPDFVYPVVPDAMTTPDGAARIDAGWRYLQNNDLRGAAREFDAALKRAPDFYPARAGAGYVELAGQDYGRAAASFDAALRTAPRYVPALVGRGQALLQQGQDAEALASFEAALAVDSTLVDLRRRVALLQFRNVQDQITTARAAAAAGRTAEARAGYTRALQATPDSAFLHRELGILERRSGNADAALEHVRRASELDPTDTMSLIQVAELLQEQDDFAGAEAFYRRAAALEPGAELAGRIAAMAEAAREARLPAAYTAIAAAREVTRGELAALFGVRLEPILGGAVVQQVVLTDTGGHWARRWIDQVARAGIIPPFEDHTFQPGAVVRRGDLAAAVNRVVSLLAARSPDLRVRLSRRIQIADMSPTHLSYPAASAAVASGVMSLLDGDRFDVGRVVTGAEALDAVDRIRALARTSR